MGSHDRDYMKQAPYGTWHSALAAADLARSAITLNYLQTTGGALHWVESRPADGGRYVIVTPAANGEVRELTPSGFNVRTRVHEYGGTPYALSQGAIYFSNFSDQRLYVQRPGEDPIALTPQGYRYADYEPDSAGSRLFCVREDHTGGAEPKNAIVALDTRGNGAGSVLFGGSDFVAYPRVSPDGRRMAWIAWDHPDMPWDTTTLCVADLTSTGLSGITPVAGGSRESVMEPRWDTDGTLYFISDRSNWWNLFRYRDNRTEPVFSMEAELGNPLWTLGQSNYVLTGDGRAIVRYGVAARDRLGVVNLQSGQLIPLDLPFVGLSNLQLLSPNAVAAIAASPSEEAAVVTIDLRTARHRVLRAPGSVKLDAAFLSVAEPIEFPTAGGLTAHAFYYPPVNPEFKAPSGEKPPLVVKVHGGPTSH